VPTAAEAPASFRLLVGNGDRAFRIVLAEQSLRRRTALLIPKQIAETATLLD
jgi:hypothetical protein